MGKSKKQKNPTTTSLSSQLANLKKAEPATVVAHSYVSFLFERQQASLISTDTIWNIANEGLQELIKLDSRFTPYESTLFSETSKQFVRDLQTRDENSKLDASIGSFLRLLSPYFMQKSAHKAIEYLLRRYR
jgi:U3 small nucleolar RNA-associated protein 10